MKRCSTVILLILSISFYASAKEPVRDIDENFIRKHLQTQSYSIEPDAAAIVLYEKETTVIEDGGGILRHVNYIHKVIKILNPEAFQLANIHIGFPHDNNANYVEKIRGATYNLSGDKIDTTTITEDDLLKKGIMKKYYELSFSLPAVRQGSIIDYTYQVVSNTGQWMYVWDIQENYPKLFTQYSITFPGAYEFSVKPYCEARQIAHNTVEEALASSDSFCIIKKLDVANPTVTWIKKNVRSVKKEPFVMNNANHTERLDILLTGLLSANGSQSFIKSWEDVNEKYWTNELRKTIAARKNNFLTPILDSVIKPGMSEYAKAGAIFRYVRANFTNNDERHKIEVPDMDDVFTKKTGTGAEINIMMLAMLRKAGLNASPLLLSTTSVVSSLAEYPVIFRLNYVAAVVTIDSNYLLLDASDKNNIEGLLPPWCYNGYAWILADKGQGIYLYPDLISDRVVNGVNIHDFTDSTAVVEITRKYGQLSSMAERKKLEQDKDELHINELKLDLPQNYELKGITIQDEKNPDALLVIKYKYLMTFPKNTPTFFIKDAMINFFDENPFKATTRTLPIEMPCKQEFCNFLVITLPDNLIPDTQGEPKEFHLNNDAMQYTRSARYTPEMKTLTMNISLKINSTTFEANQYDAIRSFFQRVIDSNNEVFVLKRSVH